MSRGLYHVRTTGKTALAAIEQLENRALLSASVSDAPAPATPASVHLSAQFVSRPLKLPVAIGGQRPAAAVALRLSNTGTAAANGKLSGRFYISTDATLDSSDLPAGAPAGWHANIKPDKSEKLVSSVVIPSGVSPGSYFLLAVVNGANGTVAGQSIFATQPLTLTKARPTPSHHQHQDQGSESSDDGGILCLESATDDNTGAPTTAPVDNTPATAPSPPTPATAPTTSPDSPADNSAPAPAAPDDNGGDGVDDDFAGAGDDW